VTGPMGFITPLGPFISAFLDETSPYINRPNVKRKGGNDHDIEEGTIASHGIAPGAVRICFGSCR
jgi:hypothetical protein